MTKKHSFHLSSLSFDNNWHNDWSASSQEIAVFSELSSKRLYEFASLDMWISNYG